MISLNKYHTQYQIMRISFRRFTLIDLLRKDHIFADDSELSLMSTPGER